MHMEAARQQQRHDDDRALDRGDEVGRSRLLNVDEGGSHLDVGEGVLHLLDEFGDRACAVGIRRPVRDGEQGGSGHALSLSVGYDRRVTAFDDHSNKVESVHIKFI